MNENMLRPSISESNSEAPAVLQSAIHYYSDAAESYVKEDCVRHAQRCVRQARLAALQLHLLTTPHRVINMNKEEVGVFVSNHPKFWEVSYSLTFRVAGDIQSSE